MCSTRYLGYDSDQNRQNHCYEQLMPQKNIHHMVVNAMEKVGKERGRDNAGVILNRVARESVTRKAVLRQRFNKDGDSSMDI